MLMRMRGQLSKRSGHNDKVLPLLLCRPAQAGVVPQEGAGGEGGARAGAPMVSGEAPPAPSAGIAHLSSIWCGISRCSARSHSSCPPHQPQVCDNPLSVRLTFQHQTGDQQAGTSGELALGACAAAADRRLLTADWPCGRLLHPCSGARR